MGDTLHRYRQYNAVTLELFMCISSPQLPGLKEDTDDEATMDIAIA